MMEKYNQYSREQLTQTIRSLENENKFLKEYIRGTKDFKELNSWIENKIGGEE